MDKNVLKSLSKELVANSDDYMNSFRKNLELYASQKNITLRDIADEADISLNTLNSILYGNVKDCKLSTTISLARALQVSIDELVGCETIHALTRESMQISRNLPANSLHLIRWFIRNQEQRLKSQTNRHMLNVMHPTLLENGNLQPNNVYTSLDINNVSVDIRSKIFVGIKLKCDYYMPTYSPYDVLLIANDRDPHINENSVFISSNCLYIGRRQIETTGTQKVTRYESIRNQKSHLYEDEIDEVIGYIAGIYTEDTI